MQQRIGRRSCNALMERVSDQLPHVAAPQALAATAFEVLGTLTSCSSSRTRTWEGAPLPDLLVEALDVANVRAAGFLSSAHGGLESGGTKDLAKLNLVLLQPEGGRECANHLLACGEHGAVTHSGGLWSSRRSDCLVLGCMASLRLYWSLAIPGDKH